MRLSKTVGSTTTKYYYIGSELTYMTVGADTIGRFISADGFTSTGQGALGTNAYVYCGNNPVNFVDPTGTEFVSIAVVSLAAALGVSLISALVLLNATLEFQNSVKRVAVCYCTIKG